jgi:hypothetical protein
MIYLALSLIFQNGSFFSDEMLTNNNNIFSIYDTKSLHTLNIMNQLSVNTETMSQCDPDRNRRNHFEKSGKVPNKSYIYCFSKLVESHIEMFLL